MLVQQFLSKEVIMNKNLFLAYGLLLSFTGIAWGTSDNKDKAIAAVVKEEVDNAKNKNEAIVSNATEEKDVKKVESTTVGSETQVSQDSLFISKTAGVLAAPFALFGFTMPIANVIKEHPGYALLAATALTVAGIVAIDILLADNDEEVEAEENGYRF
jgi:hypothetical protein